MNATTRYLERGSKRVSGWLNPFSASLIAALSDIQQAASISGSVGEIGVHHGRLFILMQTGAEDGVPSVAIDVFEDQDLNTGNSGNGDRAIFERNLGEWGSAAGPVHIIQRSSLLLTPKEYLAAAPPARLFSVDGGHTAECAENDMRFAEAVLHPAGIVIVDDIFNEFWPDVVVGVSAYCRDPSTHLRPFAMGII